MRAASAAARTDARPNVVVVLVDDMGWSDIGPYGGEIPTPNLDALARGGVRFTQFYATPRCSPTGASLLAPLPGTLTSLDCLKPARKLSGRPRESRAPGALSRSRPGLVAVTRPGCVARADGSAPPPANERGGPEAKQSERGRLGHCLDDAVDRVVVS